MTKEDLLEVIHSNIDDLPDDALREIAKELCKHLKDAMDVIETYENQLKAVNEYLKQSTARMNKIADNLEQRLR